MLTNWICCYSFQFSKKKQNDRYKIYVQYEMVFISTILECDHTTTENIILHWLVNMTRKNRASNFCSLEEVATKIDQQCNKVILHQCGCDR